MCYLPPGPRCSNHAYKELIHAQQAVEKATNVNTKLALQLRADEAQKNYYATPRGQNELKRDIGRFSGSSSDMDKTLLWNARRALLEGEALRAQQLKDFYSTVNSKQTVVKDILPSRNKNEVATAIAFNSVLKALEGLEVETHVREKNFITIQDGERTVTVFCLPEKYQDVWDVLKEDENGGLFSASPEDNVDMNAFTSLLSESLVYESLSPEQNELVTSWIQARLRSKGIDLIATVDRRTENVAFFTPDELTEFYNIDFKLAKRLGGTTQYRKGVEALEGTLKETVFAEAEIVEVKDVDGKLQNTILLNVQKQPEIICSVPPVYLSWVEPKNEESEGYYVVRSKHMSTSFNVKVILEKRNPTLTFSSSDALMELFSANVSTL